MVRFPQFFGMVAESGFDGPLQMHFEYPLGGRENGAQVYAAMKRDLAPVARVPGKGRTCEPRAPRVSGHAGVSGSTAGHRRAHRRASTTSFEDYRYRAPYKFGGKEVDRVTLLNVRCRLSNRAGKSAEGFAAMPLGNVWSFPAPDIPYDTTLAAMKSLAQKIAHLTRDFREYAHPLDVNHALEPEYLKAAAETTREMNLARPIPKLCTLVTASPVDAALHDAFGSLHGRNSFTACGKDFVRHDLSHYLNADFRGEYLDRTSSPGPRRGSAMYHSVGASDPLTAAEVNQADGRRAAGDARRLDSLQRRHRHQDQAERRRPGLGRGPRGGDRSRDYGRAGQARCAGLDLFARLQRALPQRAVPAGFRAPLKGKAAEAFDRVQYIEQPTARDLAANRQNTMFEAAKLRAGGDRRIADRVGYAAAGARDGLYGRGAEGLQGAVADAAAGGGHAEVQDVPLRAGSDVSGRGADAFGGNRGACPRVTALEANAREYVPAANRPWEKRFPGIFIIKDGFMDTSSLDRPGLSTDLAA